MLDGVRSTGRDGSFSDSGHAAPNRKEKEISSGKAENVVTAAAQNLQSARKIWSVCNDAKSFNSAQRKS